MNYVPATAEQLSDTLATITTDLVAAYDGLALLDRITDACAMLLATDATGVLVTDPRGGLALATASDESARAAELWQAHTEEGPCLDCVREQQIVAASDLASESQRWPQFVPVAHDIGYAAVYAVPMLLNGEPVGGVNLHYTTRTELADSDLRIARLLTDLAVLGLSQEHDERRAERLIERTMTTINDRARLGHAIGLIAGTLSLRPDAARALLAEHARETQQSVVELAQAITDGTITVDRLSASNQSI